MRLVRSRFFRSKATGLRFVPENTPIFTPGQIPANQKFIHLGVMGILHSHWFCRKPMSLRKGSNFLCVVVGHQEIAMEFFTN
jgi:hypothetical protein